MTIRIALLAAWLACTAPAHAQGELYAAWLLDASRTDGPSMQVWRESETSTVYTWRLVAGDGTLLAHKDQPRIPKGYTLNFGECRIAGKLRHDVLAIVRHRPKREWSADVRAVWVASPGQRAFVRRSKQGVTCRDEGFGIGPAE